jgi:hypothetical protein
MARGIDDEEPDERVRQSATGVAQRLQQLAAEARHLPVLDARPADEILGYGDHGLPT